MGRPATGRSAKTKYRNARATLAEHEAQIERLERSRPRTRGKRASKTRQLNTLKKQRTVARGLLTKAKNAIAQAARGKTAAKKSLHDKRSEAARTGATTRKARLAAAGSPPAAPLRPLAVARGLHRAHMPFLVDRGGGTSGLIEVDPETKTERSLVGAYWNHFPDVAGFADDSIFDRRTQKRYPFVTDPDLVESAELAGYDRFTDIGSQEDVFGGIAA